MARSPPLGNGFASDVTRDSFANAGNVRSQPVRQTWHGVAVCVSLMDDSLDQCVDRVPDGGRFEPAFEQTAIRSERRKLRSGIATDTGLLNGYRSHTCARDTEARGEARRDVGVAHI